MQCLHSPAVDRVIWPHLYIFSSSDAGICVIKRYKEYFQNVKIAFLLKKNEKKLEILSRAQPPGAASPIGEILKRPFPEPGNGSR